MDQNGAGEGAVDLGGPTREYFRLALQQAIALPIFEQHPTETGRVLLCRNAIGEYVHVSREYIGW